MFRPLLFLILFAVRAVAPFADAQLEARSDGKLHWSEPEPGDQEPAHDPATCAICFALTASSLRPAVPPDLLVVIGDYEIGDFEPLIPHAHTLSSQQARGPPE